MKKNKPKTYQALLAKTGIVPETSLESSILAHPEFQKGALYGKPRRGHPEGRVIFHIAEVLENVDRYALDAEDRRRLRLITLIHDTFKYKVDKSKPKVGPNHHARLARAFAEPFITDAGVLDVIEMHDDAYNIWSRATRSGKWDRADAQLVELLTHLDTHTGLYARFYRCDNHTGNKGQEPFEWFMEGLGVTA